MKTLVCIVKGVFRFAYKNKMIPEDLASDIQRSTFYKQCEEKDRPIDTILISNHDWSLLYERLRKDFEETPTYMAPYAILFAAFTGVRVGELSVLKWEDVRQNTISKANGFSRMRLMNIFIRIQSVNKKRIEKAMTA